MRDPKWAFNHRHSADARAHYHPQLHPKSSPPLYSIWFLPFTHFSQSVGGWGGTGSLFACHCWPLCGIETKAIVSAATKRDTLALGPPYFLTLHMPWYRPAPSPTPTPAHDTDGRRMPTYTYLHRLTLLAAAAALLRRNVAVFQIWHMWMDCE